MQDVFVFGRVRSRAEVMDRVRAVTARDVREAFERMMVSQASVAVAGRVPRTARDSWRGLFTWPTC